TLELIKPRIVIRATLSKLPRPRSTVISRNRASGSWSDIAETPRRNKATIRMKLRNKLAQRATNRNRVRHPVLRSAMRGTKLEEKTGRDKRFSSHFGPAGDQSGGCSRNSAPAGRSGIYQPKKEAIFTIFQG